MRVCNGMWIGLRTDAVTIATAQNLKALFTNDIVNAHHRRRTRRACAIDSAVYWLAPSGIETRMCRTRIVRLTCLDFDITVNDNEQDACGMESVLELYSELYRVTTVLSCRTRV